MFDPRSLRVTTGGVLVAVVLFGMALVVASGARGARALIGFILFCLGMAALDGLHRDAFGFRQLSIFLGAFAVGLGMWSVIATGLLVAMDMRVPSIMRSLLVVSAASAAGCAAAALLAVRSPSWMQATALKEWLGGVRKRFLPGPRPLGDQRHDRPYDAGQPLRPAGPVQGG